MSSSRWQDNNIGCLQADLAALGASESNPNEAPSNPEHFMRPGMEMVEVINPITPRPRPFVVLEEYFEDRRRIAIWIKFDRAAIMDQRIVRIIRRLAVVLETLETGLVQTRDDIDPARPPKTGRALRNVFQILDKCHGKFLSSFNSEAWHMFPAWNQ
jgi:hypothetical protein